MKATAIHWLFPLADPITLPEGSSWRTAEVPIVSIALRQVEAVSSVSNQWQAMMLAAQDSNLGTVDEIKTTPLLHPTTVVEMVALFEGEDPTDEDAISAAFDRGIELAQGLVNAYNLVASDFARVPTRESLPPLIPMATRDPLSANNGFPGSLGVYFANTGSIRSTTNPELNPEQAAQLEQLFSNPVGVFIGYKQLKIGAKRSLERDGDYRSAVVGIATAAEVLLDQLLLHTVWQEKSEPQEAANLFADSRQGLVARLKREYSSRLGGDWNPGSNLIIGNWRRDVAVLRNAVVHRGVLPSLQEARRADHALLALESYVIDTACRPENLRRYPQTALALVGTTGLAERKLFSKSIEARLSNLALLSPEATFSRWSAAVWKSVELALGDETWPEDGEPGEVFVVVETDGHLNWVIVDTRTGLAAKVRDPSATVSPEVKGSIANLLNDLKSSPVPRKVSILVEGVSEVVRTSDWTFAHELLPNNGVMVDGRDQ